MALKKSQLYSKLWQSCGELRGGMDASQYKDYVLTLLFVKYVSDNYAADPAALIEVPPGARFADMVAAKGDKEIGDRINKIIGKLAEANDSLKGAINVADFNDEEKLGKGKEMVDRLSKLVAIFEGLVFGRNRAEGDDLLGDAYEYLMRHFATESGKSKGQFYTPAEVSRVMAQVIGLDKATSASQTIYDPTTCGSGSLLLKAHDLAKSRTGHDLSDSARRQFSGTRGAMFLVGPHGLGGDQLFSVAQQDQDVSQTPTALRIAVSRFLSGERRDHVVGVGFLSESGLQPLEAGLVESGGTAYYFPMRGSPKWSDDFSGLFSWNHPNAQLGADGLGSSP